MALSNIAQGAGFAIGGGAAFATMGALIKIASPSLNTEMVVFLRNFFGLIALLPWLYRIRMPSLKTERFGGHILRAAFGLSAMYCFFYAIHHMPLANAVLLNYSAPVFAPVIAYYWIKEKFSFWTYPAVSLGFVGIIFILHPTVAFLTAASMVGMLSGILAAIAMISIRRMANTEPATRIVFFFTTFSVLLSSIPLLWAWQTPHPLALMSMLGAGIFATLGQLSLTKAYALAPAAQIGSLIYSAVVFSAIWGWLIWDENLDRSFLIGTLLIATGSLLATLKPPGRAKLRFSAIRAQANMLRGHVKE
ncbi:MAG: DMT family transporter [Nevskiales bacterium]